MLSDQDWNIRTFIYRHFVEAGQPPTYPDVATAFNLTLDAARETFRRLNDAHAIFLTPGTDAIRMANPLSALPTDYRVQLAGRPLWLSANCAWDSLGIPAMLHTDAEIEAKHRLTGEVIRYAVRDGDLVGGAGIVVHFPLPFSRWYDDLVDT